MGVIHQPKVGQKVRLHYAKRYAWLMPYHGHEGEVVAVARGSGPVNAAVKVQGKRIIVPRGNLILLDKKRGRRQGLF